MIYHHKGFWACGGTRKERVGVLVSKAMEGKSDEYIVAEISRRLGEECKKDGKDTITMADIKRVKMDIYEGR